MHLHHMEDTIHAQGGDLVIIGNGLPSFIAGFREKSGFEGPLYTDPGRQVYKALELRKGLGSSLNLRSVRRAMSAYRRGFRQTRTRGDAMQQGGVFVISSNGQSTYEYRAEYAGDHPRREELLAALERAVLLSKGASGTRSQESRIES